MANIDDAFPSKYLKASDLHGGAVKLTIADVKWETIGDERKLIVYFNGTDKGLVLNKTNANRIAFMHGKDYDTWGGKVIEAYQDMVEMQGRTVEAVRVRPPSKPAQQPAPKNGGFASNARQSSAPPEPPPASEADYGLADLDSEIPF